MTEISGGSPVSNPIAIPQGSSANSSPNQRDEPDDDDDVFEAEHHLAGLPSAGSPGSGGSVPTPRAARALPRRLTEGDFQNLPQEPSSRRPQSGYARGESSNDQIRCRKGFLNERMKKMSLKLYICLLQNKYFVLQSLITKRQLLSICD